MQKFQDIEVFNDVSEMFKKKRIDCLYVAVNPKVNFDIYNLINKKQIPVIFEKPMVNHYEQAKIIEKSCSKMIYPVLINLPILYDKNFDHIQNFINENYEKIKKIIILEGGSGPFRKTINPIWDWGTHPLVTYIKIIKKRFFV